MECDVYAFDADSEYPDACADSEYPNAPGHGFGVAERARRDAGADSEYPNAQRHGFGVAERVRRPRRWDDDVTKIDTALKRTCLWSAPLPLAPSACIAAP